VLFILARYRSDSTVREETNLYTRPPFKMHISGFE